MVRKCERYFSYYNRLQILTPDHFPPQIGMNKMDKNIFIQNYSKQIKANNAIVFVGAGLSIPAGAINWQMLIEPWARQLNIGFDKHTFPQIVQWYIDYIQNRRDVIQEIIMNICPDEAIPTENYRLLAKLAVSTFWTTNYDHLLEDALKYRGVKVISKDCEVAFDRPNSYVNLYKMHGDKRSPESIVISQDDYDRYAQTHSTIYHSLQTDLNRHTCLFLGYSFSDPNLHEIFKLSKSTLKSNMRTHYCIIKNDQVNDEAQEYRIRDLRKYHIETVLISDYDEITELLTKIYEASTSYGSEQLSYNPSSELIGRTDELNELKARLLAKNSVCITGPIGVGKTVIAEAVFYSICDRFTYSIRRTCGDHNEDNYESILDFLSHYFNRPHLTTLTMVEKEIEISKILSNKPSGLIYLDGINNNETLIALSSLAPYAVFIITSRIECIHNAYYIFPVRSLEREHAIKLFKHSSGQLVNKDEDHQLIDELCKNLGDIPMTIELCANYSKANNLHLKDLVKQLKMTPELIISKYIAIIKILYESFSDAKKEYFTMLSIFGGNEFDYNAVKGIYKDETALLYLTEIRELSLIKTNVNKYYLLPAVQSFAEQEYKKRSNKRDVVSSFIGYYIEYCKMNRQNYESLQFELSNILLSVSYCREEGYPEQFLVLLELLIEAEEDHYNAYGFLSQRGYYNECIDIIQKAIQYVDDPKSIARYNLHLGSFHYWLGNNEIALTYFLSSKEYYEMSMDIHGQVIVLHRIGFIYSDWSEYEKCLDCYTNSYDLALSHLGNKNIIATSMHYIGVVKHNMGIYSEAEKFLSKAYLERVKINKGVTVSQRRLAAVFRMQGKIDKAKSLLLAALSKDRLSNKRNLARTLRQLGMLYLSEGNLDDAINCFMECNDIFQEIGDKKGISSTMTNIAQYHYLKGNYSKAIEIFYTSTKMADVLRNQYGKALCIYWISRIEYIEKKYFDALAHLSESIRIMQNIKYVHLADHCNMYNDVLKSISKYERTTITIQPLTSIYPQSENIYNKLYELSQILLLKNNPVIDTFYTRGIKDNRRGISLIYKPSQHVCGSVQEIQGHLTESEPQLYIYPSESLHVTISSVINASEDYQEDISRNERISDIITNVLDGYHPIPIHFRGIIASSDCILVKGYFSQNTIDKLRTELGIAFSEHEINVNERYINVTAHITIARFISPSDGYTKLLHSIKEWADYDIGLDLASDFELVECDWYHSPNNTSLIRKYNI